MIVSLPLFPSGFSVFSRFPLFPFPLASRLYFGFSVFSRFPLFPFPLASPLCCLGVLVLRFGVICACRMFSRMLIYYCSCRRGYTPARYLMRYLMRYFDAIFDAIFDGICGIITIILSIPGLSLALLFHSTGAFLPLPREQRVCCLTFRGMVICVGGLG